MIDLDAIRAALTGDCHHCLAPPSIHTSDCSAAILPAALALLAHVEALRAELAAVADGVEGLRLGHSSACVRRNHWLPPDQPICYCGARSHDRIVAALAERARKASQ